ncbi:hypothetical protein, partial [Bradyrhizobium sp. 38]|uniref:hypothetical protein n=1 Tax=Bradyrhizobium sp. 38 TaxID=2782672 RepID=UPI001FF97157
MSQFMPCTKIVTRHYDPVVSIIADAAESVRPNSALETIRRSRPSIATAGKMLELDHMVPAVAEVIEIVDRV